jgi:uncharacterized membrane protein
MNLIALIILFFLMFLNMKNKQLDNFDKSFSIVLLSVLIILELLAL